MIFQIEDLSEWIIIERHARCEVDEKKRFTSVLKKRGRGSRSDSKASNTEPATPEADSALAALHTPPNTPASNTKAAGHEESDEMRKRSGSCSSRTDDTEGRHRSESRRRMGSMSRSRSQSIGEERYKMEPEFYVDPWEIRTFPLSEEEYNKMFQQSSSTSTSNSSASCSVTIQALDGNKNTIFGTSTPEDSVPCSPHSSTSSEVIDEDDPNDPEWTVVAGEKEREKLSLKTPTIVLKLAKR